MKGRRSPPPCAGANAADLATRPRRANAACLSGTPEKTVRPRSQPRRHRDSGRFVDFLSTGTSLRASTPMRYPASETAEKHERILTEAARLFRERGKERLTDGDLSRVGGTHLHAVNQHFERRRDGCPDVGVDIRHFEPPGVCWCTIPRWRGKVNSRQSSRWLGRRKSLDDGVA